jgi:hypothetical protein
VVFSRFGGIAIYQPDGQNHRYPAVVDTGKNTITVFSRSPKGSKTIMKFSYHELPGKSGLVLDGTVDSDTVHAQLRRFDESSFVLVSDPYHWISDTPHNR